MLILSRKENENILVDTSDGQIKICVLKTSKEKVSIGIDAPISIPVNREEIVKGDKK